MEGTPTPVSTSQHLGKNELAEELASVAWVELRGRARFENRFSISGRSKTAQTTQRFYYLAFPVDFPTFADLGMGRMNRHGPYSQN